MALADSIDFCCTGRWDEANGVASHPNEGLLQLLLMTEGPGTRVALFFKEPESSTKTHAHVTWGQGELVCVQRRPSVSCASHPLLCILADTQGFGSGDSGLSMEKSPSLG